MSKENGYLDDIELNSKKKVSRVKSILSSLDDIEDDDISLPSSIFNKAKEKESKEHHKEEKKEVVDMEIDDDWMATLSSFKAPKTKKKTKSMFDKFDLDTGEKKHKKKKDKKKEGELVDHKKDFETEMILLKNIQQEHSKFVDTLQKKYNQMENTKSTARGVGKFTTDLITSITGARSLSLQLVDKIISVKKTVADLNFKERKEFGTNSNTEQQNLTNYASTYLKQMMSTGRNNVVNNIPAISPDDSNSDDYDDLFSSIDESLGDSGRSEDVEKYLKYENDNITIKVIWYDQKSDDADDKYEFVAVNDKGETVEDYPLPEKTRMNINRGNGTAIDMYGNKYPLEFIG